MKLEYLKQSLEVITGSTVKQVFFDQRQIVNTERDKSYPFVFWDLNTYRSVLSWSDTNQQRESVTMKAYVFGYLDKDVAPEISTSLKEEKWDELRAAFRTYLTIINANQYIQITNLSSMNNELFEWGVSIDSEIAVSFDVKFDLFCNA